MAKKKSTFVAPPDCWVRLHKIEEVYGISANRLELACGNKRLRGIWKRNQWHVRYCDVYEWLQRGECETGVVYIIQVGTSPVVKIGYAKVLRRRLTGLQVSHFEPLTVLCTIPADAGYERQLHDQLAEYRIRGEWFEYAPKIQRLVEEWRI